MMLAAAMKKAMAKRKDSPAVTAYIALDHKLALLQDQGKGDTAEADEIRDEMDPVWARLTPVEQATVSTWVTSHSESSP